MRNGNVIMRMVVVGLLLYALLGLTSVSESLVQTEREAQRLEEKLTRLEAERTALEQALEPAALEREMRRLAWERLGMVMPGEKVFCFVRDEQAGDP